MRGGFAALRQDRPWLHGPKARYARDRAPSGGRGHTPVGIGSIATSPLREARSARPGRPEARGSAPRGGNGATAGRERLTWRERFRCSLDSVSRSRSSSWRRRLSSAKSFSSHCPARSRSLAVFPPVMFPDLLIIAPLRVTAFTCAPKSRDGGRQTRLYPITARTRCLGSAPFGINLE